MNTKMHHLFIALAVLAGVNQVAAQGTAFTYQGQLSSSGGPANGFYDFQFSLYTNAAGSGSPVGSTVTNPAVGVTNGLFTTTLDFGPVFTGNDIWLAISVRSNGAGSFTALTPLQELYPAPYAVFAGMASNVSGTLPASQLSGPISMAQLPGGVVTNNEGAVILGGTFSGNGAGLTNLNVTITAQQLAGWTVQLNASNGAPNLIGGSTANFVSNGVAGASIGGGGATNIIVHTGHGPEAFAYTNSVSGNFGTVGGGAANTAGTEGTVGGGRGNSSGADGTVGGGLGNTAGADATVAGGLGNSATNQFSTVAGGFNNTASGMYSTVGGGVNNTASGGSSGSATVAGGFQNTAGAEDATVVGGFENQATNNFATVPGGSENLAGGQSSFAAGSSAQALHDGAFVWADLESATPFASTTTNQFNVRANGGVRFVTSGAGMTLDGQPVFAGPLPATVGLISDPGTGNFFAGQNSGNSNTSGAFNSGLGQAVLQSVTIGNYNAGVGTAALLADTVGNGNTAVGNYALQYNTNGSWNIALGFNAGNNLTTGNNNIYIGNAGANSESGIIRIGTPGTQTTAYIAGNVGLGGAVPQQTLSLNGGMNIDQSSLNAGTVNNALTFGTSSGSTSGEGIGSVRSNGYANSFGLDFYTDYHNRMSVMNNGNVGIGTTNPGALLSVNGEFTAATVGLGGAAPQQTLSLNGGMNIDQSSLNVGTVNNALTFGTSSGSTSGEGIGSVRSNGYANSFGLDFYTDYHNRMTVMNNGNVGINTSNASQQLEVNGNYVLIDGGSAANGDGPIDAYIGGDGSGSEVQVGSLNNSITGVAFWNHTAGAWMNVSCSSITIKGGADLAEPFAISTTQQKVGEGAVVVIDDSHPGQLKLSDQPYDTRVAGVVSGANGIQPGIQMQQQGSLEGGQNVALTGRVYVQADTTNGAIWPGDLLTTSARPGYAMKVTDHARAQGAILGKAMTSLKEGEGMVLVLVTLQ